MSAITTTVDLSRYRVGVELSGWSADGPVTVYRVHGDGSRYPVRGMSAVSGGAAFGWDYETPLSASFTYEADDSGTVTSAPVSLPVGRGVSMLTVPGLPSFGGVVEIKAKPSLKRSRPTAELDIVGRSTYIVNSDVMKAPAFDLQVRTYTDADAYSLEAMLYIAPVLLLRIPGTRTTDWCYVAVSDVEEVPDVYFKPQPWEPADGPGHRALWSVSCRVTDSPVGGAVGDPSASYQALYDTGMTYQDLYDTGLTYLDVLKGEFTS